MNNRAIEFALQNTTNEIFVKKPICFLLYAHIISKFENDEKNNTEQTIKFNYNEIADTFKITIAEAMKCVNLLSSKMFIEAQMDLFNSSSECVIGLPFMYDSEKSTTKNVSDNNSKVKLIIDKYHELCIGLPKIEIITQERKSAILSRIQQHGINKVLDAITLVSQSDFLMGRKTDYKANLDFIVRKSSFLKILEGHYSNVKKTNKTTSLQGIDYAKF